MEILYGITNYYERLPLAYNKDMQEDKEAFFDSVNTISNVYSSYGME